MAKSLSAARRETATTAYFKSEQLRLFVFALQMPWLSVELGCRICPGWTISKGEENQFHN